MAGAPQRIVIAGASLAGATAAATLRDLGYDGALTLVGEEPRPPYERPPMSKEFLRGEEPFESALVRPPEFYAETDIGLRTGVRATKIDLENRRLVLDGEALEYDRLLIATGAVNRRLPVPGADLANVFDLRTADDAERIRAAAQGAGRAVVVGFGFIGAEVAASLRHLGVEVTIVELFSTALERVLGPEVGAPIAALHADHGVDLKFETQVEAFEGDGRVERVRTNNGDAVECDLAVVGVGVRPATELAEAAGIDCDDGILVDELCRTSAEDVFAAGDVARHAHKLADAPVRVEHWQNAIKQGEAAAKSMLGQGEPYAEVHWFWSDQYDSRIEHAGVRTSHDEIVIRGSLEDRTFAAFYLDAGRLVAVASLDRPRDVRRAQRVIAAGISPDRDALRDPDVDLRTLVKPKDA